MKLTDIQKQIVEAKGTNLLVSAGAGTGKTRVLVERFLKLVSEDRVPVREILALTFTDKAAAEMKTRILDRLKELGLEQARRDLESCYISTFHAFASRVLKEHPLEAGIDPNFRVMEEEEAELLKEQALESVIEKECEPGSELFKLFEVFGEDTIREGILKVYEAARSNGNALSYFMPLLTCPDPDPTIQAGFQILEQLGEKELEKEWGAFTKVEDWDWARIWQFRQWASGFSRKKKDKEHWSELSRLTEELVSIHVEKIARPSRDQFEKLALAFEASFETLKQTGGVLDFDDLQKKLVTLFETESPIHKQLLKRYQKQFRFIMVDEFQDTNPIQAKIVDLLSSGDNLFYVGDYKQSIYGFRGALPTHFLTKAVEYSKGEKGSYAELRENFRSQNPVLNFVNLFFKTLWEEDSFRFSPLETSTLDFVLPVLGNPELDTPVQILWTEQKEDENASSARRREARAISHKIRQFVESNIAGYGDIVLLFQSMTPSVISIYEQTLKEEQIPYFVVSGRGFYHQPEVRDMIQFLSYLDNPYSDISLAALLRSPIFQIQDDTIFGLAWDAKKLGTPDEKQENPLAYGLSSFESNPYISENEKEKLRYFMSLTQEFQAERGKLRIAELLDKILEKTSYGMNVLADSNGIRKYANLKKLVDLARDYESRAFVPLADFIRTIRAFENREIRESEAQVEAEKSGRVVRLMTIHAAKGLEFPIVFVADLGHEARSSDSKFFLAHPETGYGFQVWNPETYEKENTWSWDQVDASIRLREKEERKRLFYVAATRAKQKLILSGVYKTRKTEKDYYRDMGTWMEWIMKIVPEMEKSCSVQEIQEDDFIRHHFAPAEKKAFQKLLTDFSPKSLETLIDKPEERKAAESEAEKIFQQIEPLEIKPSRVIDLSVTAFAQSQQKMLLTEEEKKESLIPEEEDESLSAADFGTLVHKALELIDFDQPKKLALEDVFRGIDEIQKKEASSMIESFSKSSLFKEIQTAKAVYRELPFVLDERHGRVYGVIDLLYQNQKGDWCVVDYKTAEGNEDKVKASGYEMQLQIYAFAVHQILGITPKQGTLYFLKNQWSYSMQFEAASLRAFQKEFQALQESFL